MLRRTALGSEFSHMHSNVMESISTTYVMESIFLFSKNLYPTFLPHNLKITYMKHSVHSEKHYKGLSIIIESAGHSHLL